MPIKSSPPKTMQKTAQNPEESTTTHEDKRNFVKRATSHSPLEQVNTETTGIEDTHYPWEHPAVRKDVTRLFNLRLSEPDWLKLKYIADQTDSSMHAICLDILIPTMHRKLKKITEKET